MTMNSFEISPDTRALAERLAAVPYGGLVTLAELSGVIGRDIRLCRYLVYSAFRLARKETGAVFGAVRGEGYQRLTIEQLPAVGSTARKRIRGTARRASKSINAGLARANDVPNEVLLKANAELSMLGLVEHATRDAHIKPDATMAASPQPVAVAARALIERLGGLAQ